MSHSKSGWFTLPLTIFLVSFLLFGTIATWYSGWSSGSLQYRYQRQEAGLSVISPATLEALYDDTQLHRTLLDLADRVAAASSNIGHAYDSEGVRKFAGDLTRHISELRGAVPPKRKRGFLEDLGNLVTGGGKTDPAAGGGVLSSIGNALGLGGGNGTGGIGNLLQQGISSLGNQLLGAAGTPALFLGIGLGMGTATGLNLSDTQQNMATAAKIAADYNASATGFNQVAQNLGTGITAQLAPSLKNTAGNMPIGPVVFALAQGIGQGSANGLNLSNKQFQPVNTSDIPGIAQNLGLGISQPIASGIDIQKLIGQAGANGGQIASQLPKIAAAAGKGLGEGASAGLGLAKANPNPTAKRQVNLNQLDIPQTVGEFTRGLSESFLSSANLTRALNSVAPGASNGLGNVNIMGLLVPLASGAGKGIGEGAAIGLGFQPDSGLIAMPTNASMDQSTEVVVREFSKGLVAKFLANGTANKALDQLRNNAPKSLDAAKVAEGLARGLVEGSVDAISMVGGIQNVLSGNFSLEQVRNLPPMEPSTFNDSVGGASIAFGRGLSGQGTLLISKLITNFTKSAPAKRSLLAREVGVVPYNAISRRADSSPLAIDSNMLSSIVQVGTNAITCQGVGGLVSIASGLMTSGILKLNGGSVPLDNRTLAALPKEPIVVISEGNKFEIKIQNTEITVNGIPVKRFAIITGLHIFFMTTAFFYALPAYLALGAVQRLSVLINHPLDEVSNKKWRKIILLGVLFPTTTAGFITGVVGMGSAQHFRTAHGILGLVTVIIVPIAIITGMLRLNTAVPLPSSAFLFRSIARTLKSPAKIHLIATFFITLLMQVSSVTWVLGFTELRSISLCIVDATLTAPLVVGFVSIVVFVQTTVIGIVTIRIWLEQRVARTPSPLSKAGLNPETGLMRNEAISTAGSRRYTSARSNDPPRLPRDTQEFTGREDPKIGWPSTFQRVGDETESDLGRRTSNPFKDAREVSPIPTTRLNDEKVELERNVV